MATEETACTYIVFIKPYADGLQQTAGQYKDYPDV